MRGVKGTGPYSKVKTLDRRTKAGRRAAAIEANGANKSPPAVKNALTPSTMRSRVNATPLDERRERILGVLSNAAEHLIEALLALSEYGSGVERTQRSVDRVTVGNRVSASDRASGIRQTISSTSTKRGGRQRLTNEEKSTQRKRWSHDYYERKKKENAENQALAEAAKQAHLDPVPTVSTHNGHGNPNGVHRVERVSLDE